jgi:GT2 family glycosyltransferase
MTDEAPAASVILVARDRRDDLAAALDALAAQDGRFETLVVDDGSTDGTQDLVASRPGVIAIRRSDRRGPGPCRNEAAARARGRVLVFLDSDCRVLEGWLPAMLAPLVRPEVGAVGGAEAPDPAAPLRERVFDFVLTSPLTTGRLRGGTGARAGRYRPRSYALAVRREDFLRAGGFSRLFPGEDMELCARIERLGLALVHAPSARVHHRRRTTWRELARQHQAMGRARAALRRRDPAHREPVYLLPPLALLAVPFIAGAAIVAPAARIPAVALLLLAASYFGLVGIAAALSLRAVHALALAPASFAVQLVAYGVGFWRGVPDPAAEA